MSSETYDWSPQRRSSSALSVYLLGTVDFRSAVFLQERAVAELQDRTDTAGTLILCEHPPIVTIGRDGSTIDLPADPRELLAQLLDVERVDRGGPTLVHAPGQLAAYPILPLQRLGIDIDILERLLQETALAVCQEQKVVAEADKSDRGIWSRCGKIGFCGARDLHGISCHGFFLNVCPDMTLLRAVQSARPTNRIGSLVAQCTRPIAMQSVRESFIRNLTERLGYNDFNVFSSHPLLTRARRSRNDLATNHRR